MAPRQARPGEEAVMHGRPVVPGLAYPERTFSARATEEELWAALEVAGTPSGRDVLWKQHQPHKKPEVAALKRFSAYLGQARTFYRAAIAMDVMSRPLAGYYALLNLAKAWLTVADPATTAGTLMHGAGDAYVPKQRYRFSQERIEIRKDGALKELASRSGSGYAYGQETQLSVSELTGFLSETHQEYENSLGKYPDLLPLDSLEVLRGDAEVEGKDTRALWLRAEIDKGLLKARGLSSRTLPLEAWHFNSVFDHVASEAETLSYESEPVAYGRNTTHALPGIAEQFENSLIHTNRGGGPVRYFVVLSKLEKLLSQEAVAFAVMLHLSNVVRYRPEQLEKLAGERWSWLLSTWVPRALENALLTYGTRIVGAELRVAA